MREFLTDHHRQELRGCHRKERDRRVTDCIKAILFGDGVHPTMATKITYGWIRTGTRKPIATTSSRTRLK